MLDFIELHGFTDEWHDLGLNDDDLLVLQIDIMRGPGAAPVIKGTGGLRKVRFSPPRWRTGKRGAARVCYVYLQEWSIVLLVTVYLKKEKDDLSAAERKAIRQVIERIRQELSKRPIR